MTWKIAIRKMNFTSVVYICIMYGGGGEIIRKLLINIELSTRNNNYK